MPKIETLQDVAVELDLYGDDATVKNIVHALTELGHTDKVHTYHDDVLGLDGNIPDELKQMHVNDIDEDVQEEFKDEIEDIRWNAEVIFEILDREETEEMREDIAENIYSLTGKSSWDD